jgi:drug/metabolite transporter (DMT)-like permease
LFGVILSLLGVVIISIAGTLQSSIKIIYIFGAFAVLIAAIVGAFYTIAGKKMLQRYSALSLTTYAILIGSLGLVPFIRISFFKEVAALSSIGWCAVLFLGIFSTVIAYLLWYVALEVKSASELSVFLYFIPVLATTFSYIFFHEQITLLFVLGGALVIVGLYIVNKQNNNKK